MNKIPCISRNPCQERNFTYESLKEIVGTNMASSLVELASRKNYSLKGIVGIKYLKCDKCLWSKSTENFNKIKLNCNHIICENCYIRINKNSKKVICAICK